MVDILSKIFREKQSKIGDRSYDHDLSNSQFGANLFFTKIYYATSACMTYIRKMLNNREMVDFQR